MSGFFRLSSLRSRCPSGGSGTAVLPGACWERLNSVPHTIAYATEEEIPQKSLARAVVCLAWSVKRMKGRWRLLSLHPFSRLGPLLHYAAEGVRAAALFTNMCDNVVFAFTLTHDHELLLATRAYVFPACCGRLDMALLRADVSHRGSFCTWDMPSRPCRRP